MTSSQSVNYLMSGAAHTPYLVVSLANLRNHWVGKVVVYAYPESYEICKRIAADSRLRIECKLWEPVYQGKNGQFINKTVMMQKIDTEYGLYLDADTIVRGTIDQLFHEAAATGFVATQFGLWESNGRVIRNRIERLLNTEINQDSVKRLLSTPYPSVNGGVFCCHRNSPVLPYWFESTMKVKNIFIADETVLHVLQDIFNDGSFSVLKGGKYNCSPRHKPENLANEQIHIWHGHGDSFVRPGKSSFGVNLWYPEYLRCLKINLGGMQEWISQINNPFLTELIQNESDLKARGVLTSCR